MTKRAFIFALVIWCAALGVIVLTVAMVSP